MNQQCTMAFQGRRWLSSPIVRRPWKAIVLLFALATVQAHAAPRTWTDVSGSFSIDAELVSHDARSVILKKPGGETITVPLAKLSPADRRFLAELKREQAESAGTSLGPAETFRLRVGMEITGTGTATGVVGIVPVPMAWTEQQVRIVETEKSPQVQRISYRSLNDGARQMMITVPRLRSGQTARATVTFEIQRHGIEGPKTTDGYRIPARPSRDLRHYLQPGPLTDAKDRNIIAAKDKAIARADGAWEQVRAIHDYVIDNVRYQERPEIKSASVALQEKVGDCQELSSLFVAMCRAHGVPARCVWIPNHSYAEFYLEDASGRGHWFPVESTNKEQFGFLPRTQVILQKGDNFRLPEFRQPLHYARTIFKAADVNGGQPEFREIFEIQPTSSNNTPDE